MCITLHYMSCRGIDQKRNNIGLLRVGMLFRRHVPTVRWCLDEKNDPLWNFLILGWLDCGCKDKRIGECKSVQLLHFG